MKLRFAWFPVFLAASSLALAAEPKAQISHEPRRLADGVWAMTTNGGSSAGWFLFGDGVVAVDSGSEESAPGLLAAIGKTTGGKKVSYLILTNNFGPHAGGAAAFARTGATVVAQDRFGPYLARFLTGGIAVGAEPRIFTLSQRLVMSDSKRLVEIDFPGAADSGGDLVVYLPNEQILFSGDLVETAILPPLFSKDLDPEGWISALGELEKLKVQSLVPGFGPIGPVTSIAATRAYLQDALRIAKKVIEDKVPQNFLATRIQEPDLLIKSLPSELKDAHLRNVQALVARLKSRASEKSPAPQKKK